MRVENNQKNGYDIDKSAEYVDFANPNRQMRHHLENRRKFLSTTELRPVGPEVDSQSGLALYGGIAAIDCLFR